jgi:phage shock protein A
VSSITGVLVSLIGFCLTIRNVLQSKKAAEEAKQAAESARSEIHRTDAIIVLAEAATAMEEIKRLQRQNAWAILPDRYSALRNALTAIRASQTQLTVDQKSSLQGAIEQFRSIENKIDRALADEQISANMPALNKIVSQQIEKVTEILTCLRVQKHGQ